MRESRAHLIASFNSRTPGGVRLLPLPLVLMLPMFQFTHPGRGATRGFCIFLLRVISFNSRTPGGVRRCRLLTNCYTKSVSIHAPREGCDRIILQTTCIAHMFQFTHPGRGATPSAEYSVSGTTVSIHAPREGCDGFGFGFELDTTVSIHAPREGCDYCHPRSIVLDLWFQFTHPGRGATVWCKVAYYGADKQA